MVNAGRIARAMRKPIVLILICTGENGKMNKSFSTDQSSLFVAGEKYDFAERGGRPSPEEGRRLLLAFENIRHPALRKAVAVIVAHLSRSDEDQGVRFS
jgi:hypothetical protein